MNKTTIIKLALITIFFYGLGYYAGKLYEEKIGKEIPNLYTEKERALKRK